MSFQTSETIQRLWETFLREQLEKIPAEERATYEVEFENRLGELLRGSGGAGGGEQGLLDLIGIGAKGPTDFAEVGYPHIEPDFDEAIIPSQLHAAADLYFLYQHERMKVFEVVEVLQRLFRLGKIRVQRGPGAQGLYRLEKLRPLRYSKQDRMIAYRRAFNYGNAQAPAGAVVNRNFHRQLVGFMVSISQYFRDLSISEVIRGGPMLNQRPFGSVATIQRIGLDLRYALDRSTYGNIFSLAMEVGHYLVQVLAILDAPDVKRAFDANSKWDVVEIVSNRHLGGTAEPSQRAKMAESGRRVLKFAADNDFRTAIDPILFQSLVRPIAPHADAWIAAYRMTPEGRTFPGVTPALKSVLGVPAATA
ncbi:MAG TPA: hypothetical protein DDZ76_14425 [Xanthomonadales bacterium]|nr:hypothetical protein [Xanthomonadales bacterium]